MSNKLVETQTRTDRAIDRLTAGDEPVMEALQAAANALDAEITALNLDGHSEVAEGLASIAVMYDDAVGDANNLIVQYRDLLLQLGDKIRDLRHEVQFAKRDAKDNYNQGFLDGNKAQAHRIRTLEQQLAQFNNWYNENFANTGA